MNKFFHLIARSDHVILAPAIGLSMLGILCINSITRNSETFLSREVLIQSVALFLGLAAAAAILITGYRYFINLDKIIYISGLIFLLSVYVPGLGITFNSSRSWIDLGFITVQPSEVVKILFVIVMASYLSRSSGGISGEGFKSCVRAPLGSAYGIIKAALYGLPFILIVSKEDFGSGCVYCAIWIFMIFCSGLDVRAIVRMAMTFVVLIPMGYFFMAGYQKDRIDAFLNPNDLDLPGNYQVWNSKVSIGSGGFLGKGYMDGTQSHLGFLPVPESDFIFSAAVEELGFVGGLVILFLFALFIYRSLRVTKYARDLEGTLIGAGLVGMFFFQAFENIAMTMGLMPVTGITLPFLSYGGSAMVSAMMGVGLLLSVSCRQKI